MGLARRWRARTAVAFVAAVIVAYVACELTGVPERFTFGGAGVAALGFAVFAWRRGGEAWRDYGFRLDNLREAAWPIGAFTVLAAAGIVTYGLATGARFWNPELAIVLPLYPIWGVAQQFAFQGLLHRGLLELVPSRLACVVITAVAFALVHTGDAELVGLTFVAGLAWAWLFQRWPNVFLLGLSHGALGALVYPLVLGVRSLDGF